MISILNDIKLINNKIADNTEEGEHIITINKEEPYKINTNNIRLSENLFMSLDRKKHGLNNNIFMVGIAGSSKSFSVVKPNLMQFSSSFVVNDPGGKIHSEMAPVLKKYGYKIKVINLLNKEGMKKSTRFNPFKYIKTDADIIKLVNNIIKNTTPKGSTPYDLFWEKTAALALQSIFYYVWIESPEEKKNMRTVMELLRKAEIKTDPSGRRKKSELDIIFDKLEEKEKAIDKNAFIENALTCYKKLMLGPDSSLRAVFEVVKFIMARFEADEILDLLSEDEINIPELGEGHNYDGKTKTALFCVIPEYDKTYESLVGILYTQIFDQLYNLADLKHNGRLPIHVTFMLDEVEKVTLPDNFPSLLATMGSRRISSIIGVQDLSLLRKHFEKDWQTLLCCCDTLICLGVSGVDDFTTGYFSDLTPRIPKKVFLKTKASVPINVKKLSRKKSLIFIRGFDPITDDKTKTKNHPLFNEITDIEYVFDARKERTNNES